MRRVAGLLLIASCLVGFATPARASSGIVVGLWPQNYGSTNPSNPSFRQIRTASGLPIPYYRSRMTAGQYGAALVTTDAHAAANDGLSLGLNIQPKSGTGNDRTPIRYVDITSQIQSGSGPYYDWLVGYANEVLSLPTYGVVPNYIQFHSEANVQDRSPSAQPWSGSVPWTAGNTPPMTYPALAAEYIACYTAIHDLFQQMGVTDKIYWQIVLTQGPYASTSNQGGAAIWYPADPSLYDYVGVDAYYKAGKVDQSKAWLSVPTAFGQALAFARAQGKQLWIDEVGADEGGPTGTDDGAKAAWFGTLDTYLESNLNDIAGVVFSNAADGGDWYLDSINTTDPRVITARHNPVFQGTSWDGWKAAVTNLMGARYTRTLSVTTAGNGSGSVESDGGEIDCPGACTANVHEDDVVHLSAAAAPGSAFIGWGGDCTGPSPTCDVTIDDSPAVTATFQPVHALTVSRDGAGDGAVSSDGGEIACPPTCEADGLVEGSQVVLTATPDADSAFAGWSGGGCGSVSPICTVTMDAEATVTATFAPTEDVGVTLTGSGGGRVTSTPEGIDCASSCGGRFAVGGAVTLHAEADGASLFTGWSSDDPGFDCLGTGDCTIAADGTPNVTATFTQAWGLHVQRTGARQGIVTADRAAIDCGTICDDVVLEGTVVTLHAGDTQHAVFDGWTGDCTGTGDCVVTMDRAQTVVANYDPIVYELAVARDGAGTGSVTSDLTGIDCPATSCVHDYVEGTSVTLHAAAAVGSSVFSGWNGGGCTGTDDCVVSMDGARSVTASFDLVHHLLTVSTNGSGAGSVVSDDGAIDCAPACGQTYAHGTAVALTATAAAGSVFTGWSGDCGGTTATCGVTMSAARSATATFAAVRTLTVTTAGAGTGSVASDVGGISCPSVCSASYVQGSVVRLTATPGASSSFAGWSGAGCSGTGVCQLTMNAATAVTATFVHADAPPVGENAPAVAFNGWSGVADTQSPDGFVRSSDVKNDTATWRSPPTTSIKWNTRVGPAQGKALVTIDGKNKGTIDLYAATAASHAFMFSGLGSKAHTIVVKVLHTKNAASTGFNVKLDSFVAGATTRRSLDPAIGYDAWKSSTQNLATDHTYRSSAASSARSAFTFTGSSVEWITVKGNAYGKASVAIDGVPKGTVDLYQSATAWQFHLSYGGLTPGSHTIVIQVLGQKNTKATGKTVVVDGFVVHA